jgi:hypothetical protein
MGPAFDQTAQPMMNDLHAAIWDNIDKARARLAKKAERAAKRVK